jgi:hypothetical protein
MCNHDYVIEEEETPWECYLCGREDDFDVAPYGWIGDIHPLCKRCADTLLRHNEHKMCRKLSYHYKAGVII